MQELHNFQLLFTMSAFRTQILLTFLEQILMFCKIKTSSIANHLHAFKTLLLELQCFTTVLNLFKAVELKKKKNLTYLPERSYGSHEGYPETC